MSKTNVEKINSVQRRLTVEVPVEQVRIAFDSVFGEIRKKAQIQGFRQGKAPLDLIRKLYKNHVTQDVIQNLVSTSLPGVLQSENIMPVAAPVLEKVDQPSPEKPFAFTALVDVFPELKIANYKNIPVTVKTFAVADGDVQRELEMIQKRNARTKALAAETPAAKGHAVRMSHTAKNDGADVKGFDARNFTVVLGEGEMLDALQQEVLGMKAGDSKDVDVKLPADYGDPELAGKTLAFHIEMHEVLERIVPALDDELAKDVGVDSLDELKKRVKAALDNQAAQNKRQSLERSIYEHLIPEGAFEVPPALVDNLVDDQIQRIVPDKKEVKKLLGNEDVRKHFRAGAKRQAQEMLLLAHIAKEEKIQVTDAEVDSEIDTMLGHQHTHDHGAHDHEQGDEDCNDPTHDHAHHEHSHGPRPSQNSQVRSRYADGVRERLMFRKAMDYLISNAQVREG